MVQKLTHTLFQGIELLIRAEDGHSDTDRVEELRSILHGDIVESCSSDSLVFGPLCKQCARKGRLNLFLCRNYSDIKTSQNVCRGSEHEFKNEKRDKKTEPSNTVQGQLCSSIVVT